MPTIEQDIAQIRQAVYGREVREAIADGIEKGYSLSSEASETAEIGKNTANAMSIGLRLTGTATGNPASVYDGADSVPYKITADMEPMQDMHGYTKPWPAGESENLLQLTLVSKITKGVRFTVRPDGTVRASGTVTSGQNISSDAQFGELTLPAGGYYLSGCNTGADKFDYQRMAALNVATGRAAVAVSDGIPKYFELTEETLIRVYPILRGGESVSTVFKPMICRAVGTDENLSPIITDFEPYEHICQITGLSNVKITRSGKNLFDKTDTSRILHNCYFDIGSTFGYIHGSADRDTVYIPCKPNTTYTASRLRVYTSERFCIGYTKEIPVSEVTKVYGTIVGLVPGNVGEPISVTITTGEDARYLVLYAYWRGLSEALDSLQIELGSVATEYEPYQGETYSVTFSDIQGAPATVYGGTLTVNEDGSGQLVVDQKQCDLGSLNWQYDSQYDRFKALLSDAKKPASNSVLTDPPIKCDIYEVVASSATASATAPCIGISMQPNIQVKDTRYDDATVYKNAIAGHSLVYPLATPVTYNFTAEQLTTVLGTNNISCDGSGVSLTYARDLASVITNIEARLAALENAEEE